jgi:hypothetical protein
MCPTEPTPSCCPSFDKTCQGNVCV